MFHFQINFNSDGIFNGIELHSYSLETSRVCTGAYDNFHIFHYIVNGSPENLKETLQLNHFTFLVSMQFPSTQN